MNTGFAMQRSVGECASHSLTLSFRAARDKIIRLRQVVAPLRQPTADSNLSELSRPRSGKLQSNNYGLLMGAGAADEKAADRCTQITL